MWSEIDEVYDSESFGEFFFAQAHAWIKSCRHRREANLSKDGLFEFTMMLGALPMFCVLFFFSCASTSADFYATLQMVTA